MELRFKVFLRIRMVPPPPASHGGSRESALDECPTIQHSPPHFRVLWCAYIESGVCFCFTSHCPCEQTKLPVSRRPLTTGCVDGYSLLFQEPLRQVTSTNKMDIERRLTALFNYSFGELYSKEESENRTRMKVLAKSCRQ